MVELKAAFDR
jgi:hypothetical protein